MKLLLTKAQNKGILGGVKFEVKAKVELTDEESELVRHYNLSGETLLSKTRVNIFGEATDNKVIVSVNDLIRGETYKCKALDEVITYSADLEEACRTLKTYLEVARDFGGEEVIEI